MVKIKTTASKEAMRWADDTMGPIESEPDTRGNAFDIRMSEEADGVLAAKKIVAVLKKRGVCVVEANAPADLLRAAYDEAEEQWEEGRFTLPFKVHDDRSMMEAKIWQQTMCDEDKVCWIRPTSGSEVNGLKKLSENLADFSAGLGEMLKKEMGVVYDRHMHAMLSCYTGDKERTLHLDNPHACSAEQEDLVDNGLRLTCAYYINPHWSPDDCGGGLDVFLTDPVTSPSRSAAKKANRCRVAPHADTLVLFLSERMAHQVIANASSNTQRWYCLSMFSINGPVMQEMPRKLLAARNERAKNDSDSDD